MTGEEEFKRWFGQSVVVDRYGPMEVYHGTQATFSVFDPEQSPRPTWNGFGAWFAKDDGYARKFAGPGGRVYKAYLSIQKPLALRGDKSQGWERLVKLYMDVTGLTSTAYVTHEHNRAFGAYLRSKGYDGVALKSFKGDMGLWPFPQDFYVALSPSQVKLAGTHF